jgi:hypothetical protein
VQQPDLFRGEESWLAYVVRGHEEMTTPSFTFEQFRGRKRASTTIIESEYQNLRVFLRCRCWQNAHIATACRVLDHRKVALEFCALEFVDIGIST